MSSEERYVHFRKCIVDGVETWYPVYNPLDEISIYGEDISKILERPIDDPYLYRIGVVNDNHN